MLIIRGCLGPGEEVTLLNVRDNTGPDRQVAANLESSRIDPSKPNSYISQNATRNYEMENRHEFGDNIGYSEALEQEEVGKFWPFINYIDLPICKYDGPNLFICSTLLSKKKRLRTGTWVLLLKNKFNNIKNFTQLGSSIPKPMPHPHRVQIIVKWYFCTYYVMKPCIMKFIMQKCECGISGGELKYKYMYVKR